MNVRGPDWTPLTWQQLLAAYADGELDTVTHARMREWLANNPQVFDRLQAQESLASQNLEFWESVRPMSPTMREWNGVWNHIRSALDAPPSRRSWWRRGLLLAAAIAVPSVAAAVLLAVVVSAPPGNSPQAELSEDPNEQIFAIAAHGDVEILSVRSDDEPHLVVGTAPFQFPMTLVVSGDVRLDGVLPAPDGMLPDVHMGWNDTPMVVASSPRNP